jgi:spermidine synthase
MRTPVETVVEEGRTVELYQDGAEHEVVVDGRRVMAASARRAEATLAELAISPWTGRDDVSVLVAGLGMGHLVRAVLDAPGAQVTRVDVVEVSPAIRRWNQELFAHRETLRDPRVAVHGGELGAFLAAPRREPLPADGWFALILDLDEHPGWHARPGNPLYYVDEGLDRLTGALRPGGVLALWTTQRDDALDRRLRARLTQVNRVGVPTDAGLDYVYRGRRPPRRN